ncbi:MAG: type II secretion system protein [Acidobacteria bacterium]|nr:type II secretion system protein [Acidobacteriota bacterium]
MKDPSALSTQHPAHSRQSGFTLLTLLVAMSVMIILMTAAFELWSSVMRREREEELIFRGEQIVQSIRLYRKKFPGAFPPSLKMLHEQKFLRRLYAEPMTEKGQWNLVLLAPGAEKSFVLVPDTEHKASGGQPLRIVGVASQSKEKSARIYKEGADTYDKWLFTVMDGEGRDQGKIRHPRPRGGGAEEEEEDEGEPSPDDEGEGEIDEEPPDDEEE